MLKGPSVRKFRPSPTRAKELYRSLLFSFTFLYKLQLKLNLHDCEATKDIVRHLTYAVAVCLVPFILASYLSPSLSHPVSGWLLPPLIIHQLWHMLELFISQFSSLIWWKINLTKRRKKPLFWGELAQGGSNKCQRWVWQEEYDKTLWLVAGTWEGETGRTDSPSLFHETTP